MQILHSVKINNNMSIHNIVLGSTGVGKSRLIEALYQTLSRYYFETDKSMYNNKS